MDIKIKIKIKINKIQNYCVLFEDKIELRIRYTSI